MFNELQLSPICDVMGTQDPFDFIDPDPTIAADYSSCSSDSTIQHSHIGAGRNLIPPFTSVSGIGRVTECVDVHMQPLLLQLLNLLSTITYVLL